LEVCWITSFVPEMLEKSARRFLETIRKHTEGQVHLFLERFDSGSLEPVREHLMDPRITQHDLVESRLLRVWLEANADVIPPWLGGSSPPCQCPEPDKPKARTHRKGCHRGWWNAHASRWFRKVACLHWMKCFHDAGWFRERYLIWVDVDCYFHGDVRLVDVEEWFAGRDVFFVRARRPVLEASLVGYDMTTKGASRTIDRLIERYTSGVFRRDERWDDSMQLQKVLGTKGISSHDIGRGVERWGHVMGTSLAGRFLQHDKGRHKKLKIYT
jgi:hypothetical protein